VADRPRATGAAPHVVGIIGPGRAGVGLALALFRAGYDVFLHGRRKKPVPKPLKLTVGAENEPPAWIAQTGVVILAVRDDAIRPLAEALARAGALRPAQVVLHLSGAQGQEALGPLVGSGAALGSLHPLQTISDPEHAAERLKGAWAAVEGMPRAVQVAEALAHDLGLRPFHIASKVKPIYHASAVFASNYFVVVEAVAQRLLRHAGLSDAEAWQALRPLVEPPAADRGAHRPSGTGRRSDDPPSSRGVDARRCGVVSRARASSARARSEAGDGRSDRGAGRGGARYGSAAGHSEGVEYQQTLCNIIKIDKTIIIT